MKVYSTFVSNCPKMNQARCPSIGEWINCGTIQNWSLSREKTRISLKYILSEN